MTQSTIADNRKRRPGRPKVGASLIGVRVPPAELSLLDNWIKSQPKPKPSRPEAIRRLVERALANPKDQATVKKLSVLLSRGDVDGALALLGLNAKGK